MLPLLLAVVAPTEAVPPPVRWDVVVVMVGEVPTAPRPVVVLPPIRRLAGPPVLYYSPPPVGTLATPMLVAPAWGLGSPTWGGGPSGCFGGACR